MENINKEKLLECFLSNYENVFNILFENKKVIKYIANKKSYKPIMGFKLAKNIILDFLNTEIVNNDFNSKKDLLDFIKNYELIEYINGKIDKNDENLLNSYNYFEEFVEKDEQFSDLLEIMKRAQFDGYKKLYTFILDNFRESIIRLY